MQKTEWLVVLRGHKRSLEIAQLHLSVAQKHNSKVQNDATSGL